MGKFLTLGPNMRKLGEMESAKSVEGGVVAGPGELLVWEVRATFTIDDLSVQVVGRGADIESSAAALLAAMERDLKPAATS